MEKVLREQVTEGLYPHLNLASIPHELLYNTDEVAANGNLKRVDRRVS